MVRPWGVAPGFAICGSSKAARSYLQRHSHHAAGEGNAPQHFPHGNFHQPWSWRDCTSPWNADGAGAASTCTLTRCFGCCGQELIQPGRISAVLWTFRRIDLGPVGLSGDGHVYFASWIAYWFNTHEEICDCLKARDAQTWTILIATRFQSEALTMPLTSGFSLLQFARVRQSEPGLQQAKKCRSLISCIAEGCDSWIHQTVNCFSFFSDGNSEEVGPEKGARGAWLSGTPLHWVANSHSVAHDAWCQCAVTLWSCHALLSYAVLQFDPQCFGMALKSDFVLLARSVGQPAGSLPRGNSTILKFAGTVAMIGPSR